MHFYERITLNTDGITMESFSPSRIVNIFVALHFYKKQNLRTPIVIIKSKKYLRVGAAPRDGHFSGIDFPRL